MNDELAKKLKDAGFPHIGETTTYFPTLEELIEACRVGLYSLEQFCDKKGWLAKPFPDYADELGLDSGLEVEGKTPTEAVANLWLKLNNKS